MIPVGIIYQDRAKYVQKHPFKLYSSLFYSQENIHCKSIECIAEL